MSAGPTVGTASGRGLGMAAALLGAALVLTAVLTKSWWRASDKYQNVSIGVTSAETCFEGDEERDLDTRLNGPGSRAFAPNRCTTVEFSSSSKLVLRYRWFFRFGQSTFYAGIGAALALFFLVGLVVSGGGPDGRRRAVLLVRVLSGVTLVAAIAFVEARPERGSEKDLHMGYGFPLVVLGTLLGLGGSQALSARAGSILDRAPADLQAQASPRAQAHDLPAAERWPAPWPGQAPGPRADPHPRPPQPMTAPPRLALPLTLLGPPCARCAAPTRWVPDYERWHCDRCRSYI